MQPACVKRSYSGNLPIQSPQNRSGLCHPVSPDLCQPDLFVRGLDIGDALQQHDYMQQPSDSSLTCQTPMQQQQRQMSGSLSGECPDCA